MPFRSEAEQIREQIRRTEEQVEDLVREKAELDRQVGAVAPRRAWLIGFVVVVVAASVIGYTGGALGAAKLFSEEGELRQAREAAELEREGARLRECQAAESRSDESLMACQAEVSAKRRYVPPIGKGPCRCQQFDPFCDCAFDRTAAALALKAVDPQVMRCIKSPVERSLHAKITFAPSGQAQYAHVDTSSPEVSDAERGCVETTLRGTKVPFFSGSSVIVGKTFTTVVP